MDFENGCDNIAHPSAQRDGYALKGEQTGVA